MYNVGRADSSHVSEVIHSRRGRREKTGVKFKLMLFGAIALEMFVPIPLCAPNVSVMLCKPG